MSILFVVSQSNFNPEFQKKKLVFQDDMREMEEERARMREHVMQEVDMDGDGAISLEEFIKYTQSQEFQKPTNEYQWIDEMIASGDVYSDEDLRKYRLQVQEHEETLKAKLKTLKGEALELAKHKQDFQVAKGMISLTLFCKGRVISSAK